MKDRLVPVRTPPGAPPAPPAGDTPRPRVPLELLRERNPKPAALARAGFGTVEQLYDAVALQFQLARLALDTVELSLDLVNLIPQPLAVKHGIVPVFAAALELSVAASDPTQLQLFDWLARQHKRAVTVVVATPVEIERAQTRLYETRRAPSEDTADVTQEDLAAASSIVNSIIAGAIEVAVYAMGDRLVVTVRDDGRGVDLDRVRQRAVERGLLLATVAAATEPAQLLELLFHPGFSAAASVTLVSGRGIGMDVIRSLATERGGSVVVASTAGCGTELTIELPLSAADPA